MIDVFESSSHKKGFFRREETQPQQMCRPCSSLLAVVATRKKFCLLVVGLAFVCLAWNLHWASYSSQQTPYLPFQAKALPSDSWNNRVSAFFSVHERPPPPAPDKSAHAQKNTAGSVESTDKTSTSDTNNNDNAKGGGEGGGGGGGDGKDKGSNVGNSKTLDKNDNGGNKEEVNNRGEIKKEGEEKNGGAKAVRNGDGNEIKNQQNNKGETKQENPVKGKERERKKGGGEERNEEKEEETVKDEDDDGSEDLIDPPSSSPESETEDPDADLPWVLEQYQDADKESPGPFTAVNMTAYVKWIWRDNPDCRWAVRLPQALWQCQNYTSQHTAEEDYERMCHLISCGGPLDPTYMKTPPRKEGLYPFEKFYLSEQPLMDPLLAANESLSVVTFLNKSKSFTIGDTISLRIDLKDGYGHHKTKGGDVVRAWLKGLDDYNRMMMEMRDHGNGTYTATVRLMWAARVARVKVALAYPREYLRALVHLQLVMKSLKLSAGAFNNSEADEATPCSHLPLIPGHEPEDVCNLTDVNGSPWYCGRPIKDKLNCSDFLGSRNLPMPWKERPFLPVTEAEARLLDRSNFEPRIHLMGPKLEIHIEPDAKKNRLLRSPVPCTKVKPAITWQQKSPNGFFYDEVWHPFMCTPKPATIDCYKNLRMVSLGDSNVRSQHQYACDDTSSKHLQKALYKAWHAPLSCENKKLNFTSVWYPHGNPFMSSNWVWAEYGSLIPTSHAIDDLPSTGRTLVLLHHYLHLTTGHMTSMEAMHRSIHAAVVRLLKRNPQARVMIRGPHAAYEGWACHYAAGDMLVPQVEDLVANIYKDVQDRVFYFSPMDMTTATENMEFHPDVQWHIYAAMMSIMCGR